MAFTCAGQAPGAPIDEPASGQWFSGSYAGGQTYLLGYGNGSGGFETADTVGHTAEFGLKPSRVVFTSLFGSYFGDWDADNDFLRAPLAGNATGDSLGLTCFWGGRPNRFMHHLGMGETAGYGMWVSQNGSLAGGGSYTPNNYAGTHTALMGDPALRLYAVEPTRNLSATSSNSLVALAWSGSTETNLLGYLVYRAATAAGPYARLTASPQAGTSYTDASVTAGQSYSYLVRTVKRETVPGGSFDNLSVGTPLTLVANAAAASAPRNPGSLAVTLFSATNALLTWADSAHNETGYRIERKVSASGSYLARGTVAANVTTFTDTGVFTNGNVYYYRVLATGSAGDSLPSSSASFEASAGFFDLPSTRLKISKTAGSAVLSVTRIGGSVGAASVQFATSDTSAYAGTHYAATNGTLAWADGEAGAKTVSVPILNTATQQVARQFKLTLSSPSGGTSLTLNSSVAVLIEDPTATLDAPWSQTLIGGLTDSSSAVSISNSIGSVTIGGSGVSAADTAEAGQFVYQNRTGDGILTAYFPAGLPSDGSARYALMVRATTANNAVMAATVSSSSTSYGTKFVSRSASGGSASALPSTANTLALARWLRLTRTGSVFASETSADGIDWTLLGTVTLSSMPATAVWGIFHASADWSVTGLGNYSLAVAQSITLEDLPIPATPTGLTAASASPTSVSLTWNTVANASGYRMERCGEAGSFTQIADLSSGAGLTQALTDTMCTTDTPYAYRVAAYNASGVSGYSPVVYVSTAPSDIVVELTTDSSSGADATIRRDLPTTPLGTATNLTVAGYDPDTWSILTNAAKSYLRFDLTGAGSFARARLKLAFAGEERFDEAGYFNMYAYLLSESANLWEEGSITWNNAPANNLTGVGFSGATTVLGYTNVFEVPVLGEFLRVDLDASSLSSGLGASNLVTIGLAQHNAGAIVHWASREHPSFAAPTLELSSASPLPSRPSFLTASVNFGWSVSLQWKDSVSGETGFELERRLTGGAFVLLQALASNTVSFLDSTSLPASSYEYRLRAVNASGASSWTPTVSVTTPDALHAVGTLWDAGGADTLVTTPANWDTDATPAFDGATYFNFATAGGTVTVNTNISVLGMSVHRDANFLFANGGGTLTLGSGGLRAVVPNASSRTYTVAANVALAADQNWGVTNTGAGITTLLVSGPVSDGAAAFGISKAGNGVLTLAGDSSYDGTTSVASGGVLRVTHDNALGSTNGSTSVALGTWLEIGGNASVPEPLTLTADGTPDGGGNLRSTDGTNVWRGPVTRTGIARIRALAGGRLTLAGGVAGAFDLFLAPDLGAEIALSGGAVASGASRKVAVNGTGTALLGGSGHTFGTLEIAGGVTAKAAATNAFPSTLILSIGPAYGTSGTFDLNGFDVTVGQLKRGTSGAGSRVVTNSSTAATLTVSGSTSTTYDGDLSGALSLTKGGISMLTVSGTNNTYTGDTTVTAGTLQFSRTAAISTASVLRVSSPGKIYLSSGVAATVPRLYLGGLRRGPGSWGSLASSADNKDNTYFSSAGTGIINVPYFAPSTVWDGGGAEDTRFDNPNNWDADLTPALDGTAYLFFAAEGRVATLNTNAALLGLSFNRAADFTLANGGGTLTLGAGGIWAQAQSAISNTYTLAASTVLSAGQNWGVTNTGAGVTTLLVSGPVADGPSAYGISKTGNGILTLAGDSSYDGTTSVASGGVLRVTHANALGSTNGITSVTSNGLIEIGGSIAVREPLTISDASAGGALRSTDGTNVWSGRVTLAAASRVRSLTGSRLTLSGGVFGAYDLFLTPESGSELIVAGDAIQSGTSRKVAGDGEGTVLLGGSGDHTFGTLEVGGGVTVRIAAPNALPASVILSVGPAFGTSGTLDLNGYDVTVSQLKRGNTAGGNRVVTSAAPGTLTVSGSTSTVYDGIFTGATGLTKGGSSTLILSGTNHTYAGTTTVGGGTLQIEPSSSLGRSTLIIVTGGTLRLRNASAIDDSAVLRISDGGAKVTIDSGVETVGALYLGGKRQRRGTYGSSNSDAQYKDDAHFSSAGFIDVLFGTESVLMIQ
jgi:autotransporter-associated beta strand protein